MHVDVVAAPGGDSVPAVITVINTTNRSRKVRFTVEDFTVDDYGGLRFRHELEASSPVLDILERHAGSAYVTMDVDEVELDPFEERAVTCLVSLPQSALGQYYAMVRADAGTVVAPSRGAAHTLRVGLQVGAALFITAGWRSQRPSAEGPLDSVRRATPARYDVDIGDLRVEFPQPGSERQALRLVAEVENRSTVHYIGDVTAVILNVEDRRIVERIRFSQGARLVLPNSRRVYVGEVRSRLDTGVSRIRFSVDGNNPGLRGFATTSVELMEPVAGLGGTGGLMGVLDVVPTDRVTLGSGAADAEQRIQIYNNTDDALRVDTQVSVSGSGGPRLRVSPRRVNIPPGGVRSIRVSARGRRGDADATAELALIPATRGGVTFPESETRRLAVHVKARRRSARAAR
jgi:hypothetical protein